MPVDGGERSTSRPWRWRILALHACLYVLVVAVLAGVWLFESSKGVAGEFWPGWVALVFAVPLGVHASILVAMGRPTRHRLAVPAGPPPGRALATVLFTDIVGSTVQASTVGDRRWAELLDRHDRLASGVVMREGGRLVKSTGDGILATFDGPGRAIRSAVALRDGLREAGVRIRAGVHTGEVQFRDGDVGGIAVHVAAWVMAAAGPGEVLVSRTVQDLVAGSGIDLEDRGDHSLKGIAGETRLFAVRA